MTQAGNIEMTDTRQRAAAEYTRQFGLDTASLFRTLDDNLIAESVHFEGYWAEQFVAVKIDIMENSAQIAQQIAILDQKMLDALKAVQNASHNSADLFAQLPKSQGSGSGSIQTTKVK